MTNNNLKLIIDTTDKGKLSFQLLSDDKTVSKIFKTGQLSEDLLPYLEKFLRSNNVKISDLKKISVNQGPGPFSAVRSGVSVANALSLALELDQKVVLPKYDKAPNITISKGNK